MTEISKKRALAAAAAIILTVLAASPGLGWEVEVKNDCNMPMAVQVYGSHLFWNSLECLTGVIGVGQTGKCSPPGGICPIYMRGIHKTPQEGIWTDAISTCSPIGAPCCWNVKTRLVKGNRGDCVFKIE